VRALLICEDDVIFRESFLHKLCQALNEMSSCDVHDHVLSLYTYRDDDRRQAYRRGQFYSSYPAKCFWGTQAVLYTRREAVDFAWMLETASVANSGRPYDLVLRSFCVSRQHLYTTRFALVQHIGEKTTGLGRYHRAPTFTRPWPEEKESDATFVLLKGLEEVANTAERSGIEHRPAACVNRSRLDETSHA
jgi:hypothetical protein